MSNSHQLTLEALQANPLQISFTHDNVLQILPPVDGEYRVSLCTARAPSQVLLADYVERGSFILKHDLIVAQKFGQCYDIQGVRLSDERNLDLHRYTLLEDLGTHVFSKDKNLQLQHWRGLAILSGMVLTTDRGFRQKSEVMNMLRAEPGVLSGSLALQKRWPFAFTPVTGDPALLLIQHFGLLINEAGLICPNFKVTASESGHFPRPHAEDETDALAEDLGPIKAKLHLVSLPDLPVTLSAISHVAYQEKENERTSPMLISSSSLGQAPEDHIQATAGLGNRLNAPHDSVVNAGLASGKFKASRKMLQPDSDWAIFIINYGVDGQGKHGMQSLIMKEKNKKRFTKKNSCILRVGKNKEDPLIGQREVVLWKVVAACFGVYAMSNQDMEPQPLLHPRTKGFIKESLPRILELIDLWPYKGHESLKPFARARAQASAKCSVIDCNTTGYMSERLALALFYEPIAHPSTEFFAERLAPVTAVLNSPQEDNDHGHPHKFSFGIDHKVDAALASIRYTPQINGSWWEICDVLHKAGLTAEATLAQKYAVPALSDAAATSRTPIIADIDVKSDASNLKTESQTMTSEKNHDIPAANVGRTTTDEHSQATLRVKTRAPRSGSAGSLEQIMAATHQSNLKALNVLAAEIKKIEEQNLCRQITIDALTLEMAESQAEVEKFKTRMETFKSNMSAC